MNEKYNGFKEVTIKMPNGAVFTLNGEHPLLAKDVEKFVGWLNSGRERLGMPAVRPNLLNLATDLTINGFNELVNQGFLPTDRIEMAYQDTLMLVANRR